TSTDKSKATKVPTTNKEMTYPISPRSRMTLGNAIKLIRTARRVKQKALATELNVSPNYISLLESDKREPIITLLKSLASALSVPVGPFFLWQESLGPPLEMSEFDQLRELLVRIETMRLREQPERTHGKRRR